MDYDVDVVNVIDIVVEKIERMDCIIYSSYKEKVVVTVDNYGLQSVLIFNVVNNTLNVTLSQIPLENCSIPQDKILTFNTDLDQSEVFNFIDDYLYRDDPQLCGIDPYKL